MLRRMQQEEDGAEPDAETASIAPSELDKLDFSGTPSIKSAFTSSSDGASVSDSRSSLSKDSRSSLSKDSRSSFSKDSATTRSSSSNRSSSKGPRRTSSQRSHDKRKKEDALVRWLRDGTVIYKSVGLGLMDLAVGMHMVQLAREKGIGTQVEGF